MPAIGTFDVDFALQNDRAPCPPDDDGAL